MFDSAVATLVFCSVPDPVAGLRELGRVVKENVRCAGLVVEGVKALGLGDIFKLIVARRGADADQ